MSSFSEKEGSFSKKLPIHIAIIMDGNGRWAKMRGLPRFYGHQKGVETARRIVYKAQEIGLQYLSLYTFSKENWQRPEEEIRVLFKLLEEYLLRELPTMKERGIRLRALGDIEDLPLHLQQIIRRVEEETKECNKLQVLLALSYGGRQEILKACKILCERIMKGELSLDNLKEETLRRGFYLPDVPDPDLLIRTGGEIRLSNFYLYQLAYTELYFTPVLWPDFTEEDFFKAIEEYERRERRFGRVYEF